jgi:hypothetical protein
MALIQVDTVLCIQPLTSNTLRRRRICTHFTNQEDGVVSVKLLLTQVSRWALKLGVFAVALPLSGCIGMFNKEPSEIAQSWVGLNVNLLLQQWRKDPSEAFQNGDETGYEWSFGENGYYVNTSHQEAQGYGGGGQMVMGEVGGGYYQPAITFCELAFYTDSSGTITRYHLREYDHLRCTKFVNSWGSPKFQ